MMTFIKDYSLTYLRNKLIAIYVLNVMDILFTLYLKSTGCFMEANPFMAIFINSTFSVLALKLLIPAALVIYLYIRMRKATEFQLKKSNYFIVTIFILYACINILHFLWCGLYLIR